MVYRCMKWKYHHFLIVDMETNTPIGETHNQDCADLIVNSLNGGYMQFEKIKKAKPVWEQVDADIEKYPISELPLSSSSLRKIEAAVIQYYKEYGTLTWGWGETNVSQAIRVPEEYLLKTPNVGKTTINDFKRLLRFFSVKDSLSIERRVAI